MSRFEKFLYLYFSIILAFLIISALGAKTLSDESIIKYFFSNPLAFWGSTLVIFVISLFL